MSEETNQFDLNQFFFIIDSDNYQSFEPRLYGFAVEEDGLYQGDVPDLSDHEFHGCGTYIAIRRKGDRLILSQDMSGSIGLYLFRTKGYFAVSNSYFKLLRHLEGRFPLTLNQDYVNHFLTTWITSLAYEETAVNEISIVPSHNSLIIHKDGSLELEAYDYRYNTIELDSKEGMQTLDQWYSKWIHIVQKFEKCGEPILADLSGGFDSRLVFLFLLNSGIDLNKILIRSLTDKLHTHAEDFEIASEIADYYGFQLNNEQYISHEKVSISAEDAIELQFHTKMLFHKELTFPSAVYKTQRMYFGGIGGETIRPYWNMPPEELIEKECKRLEMFPEDERAEIRGSITRVLNRTFAELKKKYHIEDDPSAYGFNAFRECYSRFHFGKIDFEAFICNDFKISPILDPILQRLKLNDKHCSDKNLLIATIFTRYCPKLLEFRFDGKRFIHEKTLKRARKINRKYPVQIAFGNDAFVMHMDHCDYQDAAAIPRERHILNHYIRGVFTSDGFREKYIAAFGKELYDYADIHQNNQSYFPLRHVYSSIGIMCAAESLSQQSPIPDKSFLQQMDHMRTLSSDPSHTKARIDLHADKLTVFQVSDPGAKVSKPSWFQKEGVGYVVESDAGMLDLEAGDIEGKLELTLRGIDFRINGERVHKWVMYQCLTVDGTAVLDRCLPICHDYPYIKVLDPVDPSGRIHIHVEWN